MNRTGPAATVKSGPVTIKIYWLDSKKSYLAKWMEGGKERRIRNKDLGKLKVSARKAATRMSSGTIDLANLPPEQSAICREVVRRGITLSDLDAISAIEPATVREASDKLLESKADTSHGHRRTLQSHLVQFCLKFGERRITSIEATEIDQWLQDVAPGLTTRLNKRKSIVGLWRWARDKGMLPQEKRTVAERTDAPSLRKQKRDRITETWSPGELKTILETIPAEYLPWVCLAAFAGVRSNELFPDGGGKQVLRWEHLKLAGKDPHIMVPAAVAKTAEKRRIPVCEALRDWLRPIARKSGPICPTVAPWLKAKRWGGKSALKLVEAALGESWRKNALRHGFGTYRVIQVGGAGAVSLEMGNSERIVKNHYLDVGRTKEEAKQWFGLAPDAVDRRVKARAS